MIYENDEHVSNITSQKCEYYMYDSYITSSDLQDMQMIYKDY